MRRCLRLSGAVLVGMLGCSSPEPPVPPLPPAPELHAVLGSALPLRGPSLQEWAARALTGGAERRVALTAEPAWVDGRPAIAFRLRNVSDRVLRLRGFQLPWGNTYSIDALAMHDDGWVLGRQVVIDDRGSHEAPALAAGATLAGLYRLDAIPGIVPRLQHSSVLVLWSYRLKLGDDDDGGVVTGVVSFAGRRGD